MSGTISGTHCVSDDRKHLSFQDCQSERADLETLNQRWMSENREIVLPIEQWIVRIYELYKFTGSKLRMPTYETIRHRGT